MAARIQQGERAKGHKDFWGFAWPAAAGEGLTCNALEWQLAEGGGPIIEADNTISVNNLNTIRSWQRAAHWIGWISTPNVTSYQEWDAVNAFYTGKAAFFRGWARSYFLSVEAEADPAIRDISKISTSKVGIAGVPGGKAAQAATLGGFGLGVSQSTAHPAEALELVRFLLHREMRAEANRSRAEPLNQPEAYERPTILKADADFAHGRRWTAIASRPSTLVGQKYDEVDQAYIRAVHAVLTGKTRRRSQISRLSRRRFYPR